MRQWARLIGPTLSGGAGAAALWWAVDRSHVLNGVGLLSRQGWPLSDVFTIAAVGAVLGLIQGLISLWRRRQQAEAALEVAARLGLALEPQVAVSPFPDLPVLKGWLHGGCRMTGCCQGVDVE